MPVSVTSDSVPITHLFSILSRIFFTTGASGLRQAFCPFLRVTLQRQGRVRVRRAGGLGSGSGRGDAGADAGRGQRRRAALT